MKKILFIMILVVFTNNLFASKINENYFKPLDSIFSISKIIFSPGFHTTGIYEDLKTNISYNIIIDSNGIVELTWINKCPNKNLMVCSYFGRITKDKFYKLKLYIIESGFMYLNKIYDDSDYDVTQTFNIIYNNNKEKEVRDSTYEIVIFNNLKQMILDLKKNIKWIPNNL